MHIHAGCPLDCKIGTMRQFEIREHETNALIVIVDVESAFEAWDHASWWTRETGVQIIAKEITK